MNTLFKGETLRGLLLNVWGWATVGAIAWWAGIAALLGALAVLGALVLGFIVHERQRKKDETLDAPSEAVSEPVPVVGWVSSTVTFHVNSEVGRLRQVMLHRPGLELQRLTPANCADLLFDDVLWVKQARNEHDAFADTLRERDVEVLYLHELLAETLADEKARAWVHRAFGTRPNARSAARRARRRVPRHAVAGRPAHGALIGGITRDELPARRPGSRRQCSVRTTWCSLRYRITSSRATRRAGSTAAFRSIPWPRRRAGARRCTSKPSTASIHHFASSDFDVWFGGVDDDWEPFDSRGRRRARHRERSGADRNGGAQLPRTRSSCWLAGCSRPARQARSLLSSCPRRARTCTWTPS